MPAPFRMAVNWVRLLILVSVFLAACVASTGQSQLKPISPETPFTFVVLGDNRGEPSGEQYPVFHQIVRAINLVSPALVLSTGDLISGYAGDKEALLRRQWRGYKDAIDKLKSPVFQVPGNHDIFDQLSAGLWKEFLGATYYSFDYGRARFIALDTETDRGRLAKEQLKWLEEQLDGAGSRLVFIFLHQPLFPVDGHIGSSLDMYPAERNRLHQLLVRHRKIIKGVFQGHEHLYHAEERDGVPYYVTGGAGAQLYVPPELGGFHHFIVVRVKGDQVSVEMKKVGSRSERREGVVQLLPGDLLEGWESGLFWYTWDHTVVKEISKRLATEGRQGLKLWFDFNQCEYPLLYLPLHPSWNLSRVEKLSIDIYRPGEPKGKLALTPLLLRGDRKHRLRAVPLNPGWNSVTVDLRAPSLPAELMASVDQLEWLLSSDKQALAGHVIFDNFRAIAGGSQQQYLPSDSLKRNETNVFPRGLLESWEGPLSWGAWDESFKPAATTEFATQGKHGLKVTFDLKRFERPLLYAALNPSWDMSRVGVLALDVYAPEGVSGALSVHLTVRRKGHRYQSRSVPVTMGWNRIAMSLDDQWLPKDVRSCADQIEWALSGHRKDLAGWVVFDNFRAESN